MTADVTLRDIQAEDLPTFFENQRDDEANRTAALQPRGREAFDAHWARVLGDEKALKRTVVLDCRVAGNIVSWGPPNERTVGYWIGRPFWGRGVATAALRAFLAEETTRPLYAHVAEANVASFRVLQKCGFQVVERRPLEAPFEGITEILLRLDD